MNTTMIDLDRLEALAKAATPGPWELNRHGAVLGGPMRQYTNGAARNQIAMTTGAEWMRDGEQQANSAFIAAANPAAILELIELARRSNAGEAAGIKTWQERLEARLRPGVYAGLVGEAAKSIAAPDMEAEIAELRAALATQQAAREQQGPVGQLSYERVNDDWEIVGVDPDDPRLKDGASLYLAAPVAQQSEAGAETVRRMAEYIVEDAVQDHFDSNGPDYRACACCGNEIQIDAFQRPKHGAELTHKDDCLFVTAKAILEAEAGAPADPTIRQITDALDEHWLSGGILERIAFLIAERERLIDAVNKVEAAAPTAAAEPTDIRAAGWAVAVHNDYRLNGEAHTFWLFTKDGRAIKGEGKTDAEALDQVRAELGITTPTSGRESAAPVAQQDAKVPMCEGCDDPAMRAPDGTWGLCQACIDFHNDAAMQKGASNV